MDYWKDTPDEPQAQPPPAEAESCGMCHSHADNIRRLKSAEGHLRGIQRMLEQDTYCIDIIRQVQAVQAALNKISLNILDQHLKSCVITAIRGSDPEERERVLQEILDVVSASQKI
jgi:DNA-binding FrmR family transcriptional regulator